MGPGQISRVTGVPRSTIGGLLYGVPSRNVAPYQTICIEHAQAVMATRVVLAEGSKVDSTGTRRRLQALVSIGWDQSSLARILGFEEKYLPKVICSTLCLESTRKKVAEAYDQLWDTPPRPQNRHELTTFLRSKLHAVKKGWAPPMAWDDDDIDNPDREPVGMLPRSAAERSIQTEVEKIRGRLPREVVDAAPVDETSTSTWAPPETWNDDIADRNGTPTGKHARGGEDLDYPEEQRSVA